MSSALIPRADRLWRGRRHAPHATWRRTKRTCHVLQPDCTMRLQSLSSPTHPRLPAASERVSAPHRHCGGELAACCSRTVCSAPAQSPSSRTPPRPLPRSERASVCTPPHPVGGTKREIAACKGGCKWLHAGACACGCGCGRDEDGDDGGEERGERVMCSRRCSRGEPQS
jgi:hypothetical protein